MSKSGSRLEMVVAALIPAMVLAGCMAASPSADGPSSVAPVATPDQMASGPATSSTSKPAGETPAAAAGWLVVLADGPDGWRGLWRLGPGPEWIRVGDARTATALGRTPSGLALVTNAGVQFRSSSDPSTAVGSAALAWAGQRPTKPVVAIDYSPSGKVAVVTADEVSVGYAVSGANGTLAALTPAPIQSFSPLVAWLDDSRLLVLSTDTQQISRVAVVGVPAHTMELAGALSGVRVFALSADRNTVAAATETGVYAGPLTGFTGTSAPNLVVGLAESEVVWALALDRDGSTLSMLTGTINASGSVDGVREVSYTRQGSDWRKVLDSAVPFSRAIAQVYLPA